MESKDLKIDKNDKGVIKIACFKVGNRKYGIDIMNVKEITKFYPITPIPKAPSFIEGVINLRRVFVPIIDMKKRLEESQTVITKKTRIIIASILGKIIGILVDEAREVIQVSKKEIKVPPKIVKGIESGYLAGLCQQGEDVVLILDFEKILTSSEKIYLDEIDKFKTMIKS